VTEPIYLYPPVYMHPSDMHAVLWPGHPGLYLRCETASLVHVLDPLDSVGGRHRVLATCARP
jgi:hypothetical protein